MTLPTWLDPLPDAAQQRALDQWAIGTLGMPGLDLMERAGAGLARLVANRAPSGRIVLVCGKGNNGGDGLVVARLLREWGRDVTVMLLGGPEELSGDAAANLARLPGDPPALFHAAALDDAAAIVDAILGTGFGGAPREPAAGAIEAINAARDHAVIVACDVPSGVDASTGEIASVAVRAHATATFHAGKPGLWISPGKQHAGLVSVVDIGVPRRGDRAEPQAGPVADPVGIGLITDAVIDGIPRREAGSNKFAAGSVIVCGGSSGLTGATSLAAMAAMRAGAGYVTAAVPGSLHPIFEARLLEVMTVPLPDHDGALDSAGSEHLLERAERVQSVVLGPGLGRAAESFELAREVARRLPASLVLDADGLNAHAGLLSELSTRQGATVLTPHAGELARLLSVDGAKVSGSRLRCARVAAATANAIVVLKGDDTLVARPDGTVAVSRGDAPALATAGTGDVLAGIVGAYLAKGMEPFHAAAAAVFVHAAAGRLAAGALGPEGVVASDVIEQLPRVLA